MFFVQYWFGYRPTFSCILNSNLKIKAIFKAANMLPFSTGSGQKANTFKFPHGIYFEM